MPSTPAFDIKAWAKEVAADAPPISDDAFQQIKTILTKPVAASEPQQEAA